MHRYPYEKQFFPGTIPLVDGQMSPEKPRSTNNSRGVQQRDDEEGTKKRVDAEGKKKKTVRCVPMPLPLHSPDTFRFISFTCPVCPSLFCALFFCATFTSALSYLQGPAGS
jgi:hypothetical protein